VVGIAALGDVGGPGGTTPCVPPAGGKRGR